MSTVLCSLLLGAGFDAYVVTGYAPVAVTTSDQTGATCPMLEPEVVKKPQKMMPVASAKHPAQPKEAKYKIKSNDTAESTFLQVWCCFTLSFVSSVQPFSWFFFRIPLFGQNVQVGFTFLTAVLPLMLESSSITLPADCL